MADARRDRSLSWAADESARRVTRRSLLQSLGIGTAAAAAAIGDPKGRHRVAAQEDAEEESSTIGTRAAGGPAVGDVLWESAFDTEKIFRFVADEIAYDAYAGALRGAKGTHWGRAGNSVDQALLLADLLAQAEIPVRFAAGRLDEVAAGRLLESMQVSSDPSGGAVEKTAASEGAEFGRAADLTPEHRAVLESPEAFRAELLQRARARFEDNLTVIEDSLSGNDVALPEPNLELPEREVRQHVWVQYADGARWIDLDPSVPDAESGQSYATGTETWEVLPDELFHRVRFRAIVEKDLAGEAAREDSFVYEARSADLVGVPVVFAHVSPNALKNLGVSISGLLDGSQQYVPTILVGEDGEVGTPVTVGAGGGALDVLGAGESDGQAIGEWLEIEVLPVDAAARRVVREVFDRVGVDGRAEGPIDLASLPPIEMVQTPELGQIFLPLETVWLFAVVGGRVPASYFDQDFSVPDVQADMAVLVHGYHAARDALQEELVSDRGYRWYLNEPNLTAAVVAPTQVADDQIVVSASLDIVHQSYGVVPLEGGTHANHPQVIAGVLAHVAERIGADAGAALASDTPPPTGSVSQVFAEAAKSEIAILALTPGSTNLSDLAVSAAAKARIQAALEEGFLVVVPERSVDLAGVAQVGWWQIDPRSGRTFDLMENGRGFSPLGEDTVIRVGGPAWRAIEAFKNLGAFAMGFIFGVAVVAALIAYEMYPR